MVCHSTHSKSLPSDGSSPKDWQITSGIHLHRRGAFGNHFRIHLKTLQSNAHMSFKLVDAMQTCGTARWSPVAPSHVIAPRRRVRALLAGGCTLAMCCINGVLDKIFSWTWASIVPVPCDCLETGPTEKSLHNNPEPPARVFFFLLWPLFARAPRHWFLENFLLSAPGVQSVVFLLRSVGRRDLSAGPEQKKKTPPRVFFFCSGHGERQGKEKPRWAPARGQSKKKNTTRGVFFFLLRPRGKAREGEAPLGTGTGPEQKKNHPCRHGASPSPAFPRGRSKKKNTLGGVFFCCCGPAWTLTHSLRAWVAMPPPRRGGVSFFCRGAGPDRGGVFFFAVAPPGRSLTHCGPGWRCLPLAGVVFVFFAAGRGRTGVVFFFFAVAPPGRSLTHCGLGRFRQGPGGVFFLLRPRRVFLDNNKKCLGYYIGSKKTRRGHSKKKNTTSQNPREDLKSRSPNLGP